MPFDILLFGVFCVAILITACAMSICLVCKKDPHGEHGGHGGHEEHGGHHEDGEEAMHSSLLD